MNERKRQMIALELNELTVNQKRAKILSEMVAAVLEHGEIPVRKNIRSYGELGIDITTAHLEDVRTAVADGFGTRQLKYSDDMSSYVPGDAEIDPPEPSEKQA